jgi:hypothetical protein
MMIAYTRQALSHPSLQYPNGPQNPEKFDPQRWLKPAAKELLDYYIPFSVGSRACPGRVYVLDLGPERSAGTDCKQICNDGDVQDSCNDFSSVQI